MVQLLILASLLFTAPQVFGTNDSWQEVSHSDGIQVWKKEIPNSSILAFKGQKIIDAPISKVAQVLADNDIESKKRWIDMVMDFKIIKEINPFEGISYSSYDLPFPVSDRDFVLFGVRTMDSNNNEIRFEVRSTEHPDFPPERSVGVRADLLKSSFTLVPKNDGFKTEVTVEISTDPKGMIPKWLVNFINKNWPINTLTRLEIEAKKPETKHDRFVIESFPGAQAVARSLKSH
jgi:START domain